MQAFLSAIIPVFIVIALGYAFKRYDFPGGNFWQLAARITYFAFFPALLVNRLATAPLENVALGALALAIVLPILAMTLLLLLLRPYLRMSSPAFTSVYQGSIRFNTYIGLAIIAALYAERGVALAAIAMAMLIPLVNMLSVTVLTVYASGQAVNLRRILRAIVTNPLILACLVGIVLNRSGIGLPAGLQEVFDIFSRAALPMGLLTVGAGLDMAAVKSSTMPVVLASVLKLLALPALTILTCRLLDFGGEAAITVILFAALPGAPSAYILAQELGGDTELMAAIVTIQTALALMTLPLVALFW